MLRLIALYVFAAIFLFAGVGHFIMDSFFINALPNWVPFKSFIVYVSGIFEILLALLLLYRPTRAKAGVWTAIFLILIFPVNIYMAFVPEQFNVPEIALWLRLPLQFVLIWWVLKVTKPEENRA